MTLQPGPSAVKNPPDERKIYLALKHVFTGLDADLRKSKKIEQRISRELHQDEVRMLVEEHGLDGVTSAAKSLLEQHIFASTLKAQTFFPDIFDLSPAQTAEREASEAEAARSDETAINAAAGQAACADEALAYTPEPVADDLERGGPHGGDTSGSVPHVPSLYPSFVPFIAQHQTLTHVQSLLEQCCYAYAQQHLAGLLIEKNWKTPEQVELNIWAGLLRRQRAAFAEEQLKHLSRPLSDFCNSIAQLRHTAVHRVEVSANTFTQFLDDAVLLTDLLDDTEHREKMAGLRRSVKAAVDELCRNKDLLRKRLGEKLGDIAKAREELNAREAAAIQEMLKEDRGYQQLAGTQILSAVSFDASSAQDRIAERDNLFRRTNAEQRGCAADWQDSHGSEGSD